MAPGAPLSVPSPAARRSAWRRGRSEEAPRGRIGNLLVVWRYALKYKLTILGAGVALLVTAAATLAIPAGFRLIIDRWLFGRAPMRPRSARWFRSSVP